MLTFSVAVFLLLITPGPGVLSTAGVGAAYGYTIGSRYIAGLFVGTNLVALAVVSGLAGIMFSIPWLRTVLAILSAAYLGYLAFRIASAGSRIAFIEAKSAPGFLAGVALQIINPKAYAVSTTLFSGFGFFQQNLLAETSLKFLIINIIWIPIHFLWLAAGVSLKKLAVQESTQRKLNLGMAVSLAGVVILAFWSLMKPVL